MIHDKNDGRSKKYLKEMVALKKAKGIEIKVKNSGCSGKGYYLDFVFEESVERKLKTCMFDDLTVKIDKNDFLYLENISLSVEKDEFSKRISFKNPNAKEVCGCGESFKFEKKWTYI